jgi:hypothetical protein
LGFFGFLIPPGHSQIIGDNFPQLHPRNSRTLKIEDALATGCFEQMFIDGQERIWLTTCGDAQRIRGLHLIQFDGHSGDLHPLNLHSGASVLFGGVVHDSLLLGIALTQSKLISYSIHTQTTEVFSPLNTAFVFYNIQLIHNRVFVMAIRDGKDFVLEFDNGKFTIRKEFSGSSSSLYLEYLIAHIQRVVTIDLDLFFLQMTNI